MIPVSAALQPRRDWTTQPPAARTIASVTPSSTAPLSSTPAPAVAAAPTSAPATGAAPKGAAPCVTAASLSALVLELEQLVHAALHSSAEAEAAPQLTSLADRLVAAVGAAPYDALGALLRVQTLAVHLYNTCRQRVSGSQLRRWLACRVLAACAQSTPLRAAGAHLTDVELLRMLSSTGRQLLAITADSDAAAAGERCLRLARSLFTGMGATDSISRSVPAVHLDGVWLAACDVLTCLSDRLWERGQSEECLSLAKAAVPLAPLSPQRVYPMAVSAVERTATLHRQSQWAQCVEWGAVALQLLDALGGAVDAGEVQNLRSLGLRALASAHVQLDHYDDALACGALLGAADPAACFVHCEVHARRGDTASALQHLQRLVRSDADFELVLETCRTVALAQAKVDEAGATFQLALERQPESSPEAGLARAARVGEALLRVHVSRGWHLSAPAAFMRAARQAMAAVMGGDEPGAVKDMRTEVAALLWTAATAAHAAGKLDHCDELCDLLLPLLGADDNKTRDVLCAKAMCALAQDRAVTAVELARAASARLPNVRSLVLLFRAEALLAAAADTTGARDGRDTDHHQAMVDVLCQLSRQPGAHATHLAGCAHYALAAGCDRQARAALHCTLGAILRSPTAGRSVAGSGSRTDAVTTDVAAESDRDGHLRAGEVLRALVHLEMAPLTSGAEAQQRSEDCYERLLQYLEWASALLRCAMGDRVAMPSPTADADNLPRFPMSDVLMRPTLRCDAASWTGDDGSFPRELKRHYSGAEELQYMAAAAWNAAVQLHQGESTIPARRRQELAQALFRQSADLSAACGQHADALVSRKHALVRDARARAHTELLAPDVVTSDARSCATLRAR